MNTGGWQVKIRRQSAAVGLIIMLVFMNLSGMNDRIARPKAAGFDEINHPEVFLKQVNGDMQCTLVAATMLIRRAAMLLGNSNWADITVDKVKQEAWVTNVGLKYTFTYEGITVNKAAFGKDRVNEAIALLQQHPEGIVLYDQYRSPRSHAVLLTDYTDGIFYCADPSDAVPCGRIPINVGLVKVEDSEFYYYVSSPSIPAPTASITEGNTSQSAGYIYPGTGNLPATDKLPEAVSPVTDGSAAEDNLPAADAAVIRDISKYEIELSRTSYFYDGNEKKPQVTIAGLVENEDYTVSYMNNQKPGTAAAVISGMGNFTGVVIKYFEIIEANIYELIDNITVSTTKKTIQAGKTAAVKVNLPEPFIQVKEFGSSGEYIYGEVKISYTSSNSKIAKVNSNGKITGKKKGKANITVTVELADGTKKEFIIPVKVK